jgi:hypothetical protein
VRVPDRFDVVVVTVREAGRATVEVFRRGFEAPIRCFVFWGRGLFPDVVLVDGPDSAVVPYGFVAGGNNSVVECDLAKVEVAGSNPVSRSNLLSQG